MSEDSSGRSRRRFATTTSLWLGLLFVLVAVASSQGTELVPTPRFRIVADENWEAAGRELSSRPVQRSASLAAFVGLESSGAVITVHLLDESSSVARRVPHWISGFAQVESDSVALFPARVPLYPHDSMQELLDHELLHVLLFRAAGRNSLPRWFSEGVSLVGSRGFSLADRGYALAGGLRGGPTSITELELYFSAGRGGSHTAYALSGALVHNLIQEYGSDVVARTAAEMRSGAPFEEAFRRATGDDLEAAGARFFRQSRFLYTWLPWFSSGAGLWLGVTLLALMARRRKRQRTQDIERRWEEEERSLESSRRAPDIPGDSLPEVEEEPPEEWVH
ncbi:MAG: hypothetical protein K8J08_22905 [Thermoanaerobaculia bacterium]|nr:hypothetical protein [Thermoanaerobaculia bacterium]